MSTEVLTTWGVVLVLPPRPAAAGKEDRSAGALFARGREAYLARCLRLAAFLEAEEASLQSTAERIDPVGEDSWTGEVTVGVSVVEVRATSFDMAVRIRAARSDASRVANGRCTVAIERRATGERLGIPREVRDEFVALQLAARDLC